MKTAQSSASRMQRSCKDPGGADLCCRHGPHVARWRETAADGARVRDRAAGAATAVLLAFRGRVDQVIVVLAFLMVVVAAAATGGFAPGLLATAFGFLAFDLLFIPPYRTLRVARKDAYVSLAAYLLVTVVVSTLVAARDQRRREAEQREQQARTLYTLSQSLVVSGDLDATLAGVARTVRSLFQLAGCAIAVTEPPGPPRPSCSPSAAGSTRSSSSWRS